MNTIKRRGIITSSNEIYALLQLNDEHDTDIQIRWNHLLKYNYPENIVDENGRPKIGATICLLGHLNGKNYFYSPDQEFHKKKELPVQSRNTGGISNDEMLKDNTLYEEMPDCESKTCEFKSSLFHSASRIRPNETNHRVIIQSLIAFGNTDGGQLFIGRDNQGNFVGIEDELSDCPFNTKADVITDLKNRIYQASDNYQWVSSITFKWFTTKENHVILRISVPRSNTLLLLNGESYYVREDASNRRLKGQDLVNMIINNNLNS